MTRFRTKSRGTKTVNFEGAPAYKESPKLELVSLLLTSFVEDKFYETKEGQLTRLGNLVAAIPDKKFVAKAAIYARNEFGMRSITHALVGELFRKDNTKSKISGEAWVKKAIEKLAYRPDDMLEIVAYYMSKVMDKALPNQLRKGLILGLGKFDEYQLAKYRGERSDVKLVDIVNLVHYKPKSGMVETFKKLMSGNLKSTTWEAKQTKAGQAVKDIKDVKEKEEKLAELKAQNWAELIKEKKLGYFALLRNIRNILEQAPELREEVISSLTNENFVKKSMVLPFRFLTAIGEVEKVASSTDMIVALNNALDISVDNVPKFPGKTLVALDISGSMSGTVADIGSLFAAVLLKSNDADLVRFNEFAAYKVVNPKDSTLTLARSISDSNGGTDMNSVFKLITEKKKKYDRIIILSDQQNWMEGSTPTRDLEEYRKVTGANPQIYSFDLNGSGTLQFPEDKVFCVAGWSEKIFDVMKVMEQDRNALINKIEAIEL